MVSRTDYIDGISSCGLECVNNQDIADLFAASPHRSAPINPLNGTFIIGEFGGIVDTVKGTCPAPRPPALDLDKKFNFFAPMPEVPEAPSANFSLNPKNGK